MTIYVDGETGTWFLCPPLAIETEGWTDDDWNAFDNTMNDQDRSAYSEHYLEATDVYRPKSERPRLMSPTEWCEVTA